MEFETSELGRGVKEILPERASAPPRLVMLPSTKSLRLSEGQLESLGLAVAGKTNRQIATIRSVGPAQVRADLFVVAAKVGATTRHDMIRFAKRLDLVASGIAKRAASHLPGGTDADTRRRG